MKDERKKEERKKRKEMKRRGNPGFLRRKKNAQKLHSRAERHQDRAKPVITGTVTTPPLPRLSSLGIKSGHRPSHSPLPRLPNSPYSVETPSPGQLATPLTMYLPLLAGTNSKCSAQPYCPPSPDTPHATSPESPFHPPGGSPRISHSL